MALLVEKFCGEFFCQNLFPAILRLKKYLFLLSSRGGGVKALVAGSLKKITFFAASLRRTRCVNVVRAFQKPTHFNDASAFQKPEP